MFPFVGSTSVISWDIVSYASLRAWRPLKTSCDCSSYLERNLCDQNGQI